MSKQSTLTLIECGVNRSSEIFMNFINFIFLQYSQQCGHHNCDEIFSMVSKKLDYTIADKYRWFEQCKCLYAAGFRLIETDDNSSSNIWTKSCVLVYKPHLLPNFQVENGVVGSHIDTSIVLNFCEDVINSMDFSGDGKQTAEQIQELMNIFKENSRLMLNTVKSSFPWSGMYVNFVFCFDFFSQIGIVSLFVPWLS